MSAARCTRLAVALIGGIVGLLPAFCANARDYQAGALEIEHPYTRATPIAGGTAIGYLRIQNKGASDDTLLGAASVEATQVQIHRMTMEGGLMQMRPQTDGVRVPAKTTVDLGPDSADGYHLMLIGVKRQLEAGETVAVTLRFAHAGAIKIDFPVEALGQ